MHANVAQKYDNYLSMVLMPSLMLIGDYTLRRYCLYKNITTLKNTNILLINSASFIPAVTFKRYSIYRRRYSPDFVENVIQSLMFSLSLSTIHGIFTSICPNADQANLHGSVFIQKSFFR